MIVGQQYTHQYQEVLKTNKMGTASKNRDAIETKMPYFLGAIYVCISAIVSDSNFDVLRCVTINSIIQICKIKKETVIWAMSTFIFLN